MNYTTKGRMQVRSDPHLRQQEADRAIEHLRAARECFKLIDAPRTLARVRLALSSAKGARRNAKRTCAQVRRFPLTPI